MMLPDLSEAIASMLLVSSGMLTGFLLGLKRKRLPKLQKRQEPICGCTHHISFHDGDGCHGTREIAIAWNAYGEERQWKEGSCGCRKFVLHDDMTPAILPGGDL
jgi:hypothetical protein